MPNIKSIGSMVSKVEGMGLIDPSPLPFLVPSCNFFRLMPSTVKQKMSLKMNDLNKKHKN